jgi:outer membrane protein insertion porin family
MFGRDLMGGLDAFYSQNHYRSTYGYDRDVIGGGPRLGWSYTDKLSHRLQFTARNERLINMREDLVEGDNTYDLFRLSQTLTYRDQTIDFVNDTRRGYTVSLTNSYAGFGGDKYFIRNDLTLKQFFSFFDGAWQLGITGDFGLINSLQDTVLNSSDRYILGGDNLRGFEYGGTGARYAMPQLAMYSLGGNWRANGTVQLNFPIGIPQKFGVKGYVFYDWGVLGPPDIGNFNALWQAGRFDYSNKVRVSHGVGILWASPIGEINLSWAWQDRYEPFDRLQRFRFSIGNNF